MSKKTIWPQKTWQTNDPCRGWTQINFIYPNCLIWRQETYIIKATSFPMHSHKIQHYWNTCSVFSVFWSVEGRFSLQKRGKSQKIMLLYIGCKENELFSCLVQPPRWNILATKLMCKNVKSNLFCCTWQNYKWAVSTKNEFLMQHSSKLE